MRHSAPPPQTAAGPPPCGRNVVGVKENAIKIQRLETALEKTALLLPEDEVYLPIFARLKRELQQAQEAAEEVENALEHAREIKHRLQAQKATYSR